MSIQLLLGARSGLKQYTFHKYLSHNLSLLFAVFVFICRERRTKELMAAATKAVQQRRRPALATLETANAVAGVYAWVGGPLKAGARCILAYNCRWVYT
jgi:hypothetical protein